MPKQIPHSELARALQEDAGHVLDNITIQNILSLTSGGVAPEGLNLGTDAAAMSGEGGQMKAAPATIGGMVIQNKYKLGAASMKELAGVKSELVEIVKLAIQLTTQDFTVYDGMRTLKEQQLHVANGTSKTLDSMHLKGLAVDLVPWINGKPVWDWDGCYKIAQAMDAAATHFGYANKIRWGGAWDRKMSYFGSPVDWREYETEVSQYHRRTGKSFVDGPHFEWSE